MAIFRRARIGRGSFFLIIVGLAIVWAMVEYYVFGRLNLMLNFGFRSQVTQFNTQSIGLTALQIAFDLLMALFAVRRLNDANKSGWLLVGILALGLAGSIHFVFGVCALLGFLVLIFLPGTIGPNDYGADPNGWKSREDFDAQEKMLAEEHKN